MQLPPFIPLGNILPRESLRPSKAAISKPATSAATTTGGAYA